MAYPVRCPQAPLAILQGGSAPHRAVGPNEREQDAVGWLCESERQGDRLLSIKGLPLLLK